jgi:phospholipid/cholesterol/gamma-HCH transport system substrate-binding protein
MRHGAEVKVGLITLLAIALLATFAYYIRGTLTARRAYTIYVTFDNAKGLQRGDPVRMVGKKIGEVRDVTITPPPLKAQVILAIERQYSLYKHYRFQIAAAGLIQERSIEVIPTRAGEEGKLLEDQAKLRGEAAPDLADMLSTGAHVLTTFERTAEQVQSVLANKQIVARVERALDSLADASDSASKVAQVAATIAQRSEPATQDILNRLSRAAADMQETSSTIRAAIAQGTALEDVQATAGNIQEATKHIADLTATLDELASSPKTKEQFRETLDVIHEASLKLKKIGSDFETFSDELRKAAPSVPKVVKEAEQISGTVNQLQESLKPPEVHPDFRVLYNSKAGRTFSTGNLDFNYPSTPEHFVRLGVDDIGEESNVNIQLGEHQRLGTLRYGLVRSRLGVGFDLQLPRRAKLSLDLFNPNSMRADVLLGVPLGRSDWALLAGARDVGQENLFVIGARLRK